MDQQKLKPYRHALIANAVPTLLDGIIEIIIGYEPNKRVWAHVVDYEAKQMITKTLPITITKTMSAIRRSGIFSKHDRSTLEHYLSEDQMKLRPESIIGDYMQTVEESKQSLIPVQIEETFDYLAKHPRLLYHFRQKCYNEGNGHVYVFTVLYAPREQRGRVEIGHSANIHKRLAEHRRCYPARGPNGMFGSHSVFECPRRKRIENLVHYSMRFLEPNGMRYKLACAKCNETHDEWFQGRQVVAEKWITFWIHMEADGLLRRLVDLNLPPSPSLAPRVKWYEK